MICTPVTGCPCELATVPPTDAVMAAADMLTPNASINKTEQPFFISFLPTQTTLLLKRPRIAGRECNIAETRAYSRTLTGSTDLIPHLKAMSAVVLELSSGDIVN